MVGLGAHQGVVYDVAVVGAGPAGRGLAAAIKDRGRDVILVDPAPHAPWPATYGMWLDEVPSWVGERVGIESVALMSRIWDQVTVWGRRRHDLKRPYARVDNSALHRALADVPALAARVHGLTSLGTTVLVDTSRGDLEARLVVDATGVAGLSAKPRQPRVQAAYGVDVASGAVSGDWDAGACVLMDWRPGHQSSGDATFLYVLDDSETVLVEETSLARAPALPVDELRERLTNRLGFDPSADATRIEHVAIVMDLDLPRPGLTLPYGAAASFVHPATGYSVTASLCRAPGVAAAIDRAMDASVTSESSSPSRFLSRSRSNSSPAHDLTASLWPAVWSRSARRVRALHRIGLEALDRFDSHDIAEFFDAFFDLDTNDWAAYLSIDSSPREVSSAMRKVFSRVPARLKRTLVTAGPQALWRGVGPFESNGTWRNPIRSWRTG